MITKNGLRSLGECGIELISGQIMSRINIKENEAVEPVEMRKVVIPKCIGSNGKINASEMPEEALRTAPDGKRLTEVGDIVIKLSTPYDAGCIDEESAGCIVPSFCAIIKPGKVLDTTYLLAFLNSGACKEQFKVLTAGATMAMLSVGKIKNVLLPVPSLEKQNEIGARFLETQRKLAIIDQIIKLEQKKNDVYFQELMNEYEN